jgi:hypothetical protein
MTIRRPLAKGHQTAGNLLFHSISIAVFILSFYILLSLFSHTFLLSHIAIDPQSESPIRQLIVHPTTPQAPKTSLPPRPSALILLVHMTPQSVW